jgi:nucleoside-diphosphate-sugar epimerase
MFQFLSICAYNAWQRNFSSTLRKISMLVDCCFPGETMTQRILITGSSGLVGKALRLALEPQGFAVHGFDLLGTGPEQGDVHDAAQVLAALDHCDGIIHLAAVSRVVWGERDPALCWRTNVDGLQNVLDAALARANPPWLIFASRREIYGQPVVLPATEDTPLRPVNIYGRSKLAGETLISDARVKGMRAMTIRLSNVYGRASDHHDRVVPAFARAAIRGESLRVDGAGHTFDFTHIDDTVRGIVALVRHLAHGNAAPLPVHFLTGQPTTLGQLATLAIKLAATAATTTEAPPRSFDVARFFGSPQRAYDLLGWVPQVSLCDGLAQLIHEIRNETRFETRTESAAIYRDGEPA